MYFIKDDAVSLSTVYNRVQKSNQFQFNKNLVYQRKEVSY